MQDDIEILIKLVDLMVEIYYESECFRISTAFLLLCVGIILFVNIVNILFKPPIQL